MAVCCPVCYVALDRWEMLPQRVLYVTTASATLLLSGYWCFPGMAHAEGCIKQETQQEGKHCEKHGENITNISLVPIFISQI